MRTRDGLRVLRAGIFSAAHSLSAAAIPGLVRRFS